MGDIPWNAPLLAQSYSLTFSELLALFPLAERADWPNADGLNQLAQKCVNGQGIPRFVCQSDLEGETAYYEQIIFEQQRIPTRPESWHDLFNAVIWMLFPRTKALLNQQHMQDIKESGLSPRTKRRNHLTHFDECGIVLAFSGQGQEVLQQLAEHQWKNAFVNNKGKWDQQIKAFNFGHANYEMLLNPFIGLTGKWLAVEVPEDFWQQNASEQYQQLDRLLAERVSDNVFAQEKPLKPLPLLGVPGWYSNQNTDFYKDKRYFRPKRQIGIMTADSKS